MIVDEELKIPLVEVVRKNDRIIIEKVESMLEANVLNIFSAYDLQVECKEA